MFGGRISRVANGLPDDYSIGDYATIFKDGALDAQLVKSRLLTYAANNIDFASQPLADDYFYFIDKVNKNEIDAEPDYYSLNVLGISDHIVFDLQNNMTAKTLNNPRINVNYDGGPFPKWDVTNEDGTRFYFNLTEETLTEGANSQNSPGIYKQYVSSWVLTKIESPNKKDVYEFTYTNFDFWQQPAPVGAASVSNAVNVTTTSGTRNYVGASNENTFSPTYKIKQQYLTQVTHNGRQVMSLELGDRHDVDINSALKSITIKDFGLQTIKKFQFNQSYFGAVSVDDARDNKEEYEVRLKLDSIEIKGSNLDTYSSYQFEYFSPELVTDRRSKGRDYLGYANGVEITNTVLYPKVIVGDLTFDGADRSAVFNESIKGNLAKIVYPGGWFYRVHI